MKDDLKLPNLDVKYVPVTSATRIPLIANGTVDLECGSTTNNVARQKQVAFTNSHFLTATRFISKKSSHINSLEDLKGKTVVSTSGTTNIKQLNDVNGEKKLDMKIIPAKDHAEAFLNVETDRAVAFAMDDILLAGFKANSKSPGEYTISGFFAVEARALRHHDAARRSGLQGSRRQGHSHALQEPRRFGTIRQMVHEADQQDRPNLNYPIPEALKKSFANPSDSADPASY